jgi:hypothetical protein
MRFFVIYVLPVYIQVSLFNINVHLYMDRYMFSSKSTPVYIREIYVDLYIYR